MAVAGKGAVSAAVKPIFSRDLGEAKRRVRELYRAWYREVPNAGEGAEPVAHARAGARAQGRGGRPAAVGFGRCSVTPGCEGSSLAPRCPAPAPAPLPVGPVDTAVRGLWAPGAAQARSAWRSRVCLALPAPAAAPGRRAPVASRRARHLVSRAEQKRSEL